MIERKAGLICCSNALGSEKEEQIRLLEQILNGYGIDTIRSGCMFSDVPWGHGDGETRAKALQALYRDPSVTEIYDVSGGDLCIEVLPYLDFDVLGDHPKEFWGYSDLTVLLNAIYARTGREGVLYQVRHLVAIENAGINWDSEELFSFPVKFLRGDFMEGTIIGGNIRCFLKLAGTPFFPDLTGKILLLEAMGGDAPQMISYLNQLKLMGAFEKIRGILLGTFTNMDQSRGSSAIEDLVLRTAPESVPVARTMLVGHGKDSRAVRIGRFYRF